MTLPTQKKENAQNAPETNENVENAQTTEIVQNEGETPKGEVATLDDGLATFDTSATFDAFEKVEDAAMTEITSEYFTPEEGLVYNFISTGVEVSRFADKDGIMQDREVVTLYDRDKKKMISASAVLVNSVHAYQQKNPTKKAFPIRIICEGKEQIKGGGFYHKLRILTF